MQSGGNLGAIGAPAHAKNFTTQIPRINVGVTHSQAVHESDSGASAHFGPALRLGEGKAPPSSDMLMLAESYYSMTWRGGWHYSRRGIFNYDGGMVRSYVDGRAHAGPSTLGWAISLGESTHSAASGPAHPDELGWDPDDENGDVVGGPYGGRWVEGWSAVWQQGPPRFHYWRTLGWWPDNVD